MQFDQALSVSAIVGDASVEIGETREYSVVIDDPDGLQRVSGKLLDPGDSEIRTLGHSSSGNNHIFTLDSTDLAANEYVIKVSATGLDGGGGEHSGETTRTFSVTLFQPDAPLSLSELSGERSARVGEQVIYTSTIEDADGIQSVTAELKDIGGTVLRTFESDSAGGFYTFTLYTNGLEVGTYAVEVIAEGVDAGEGDNSRGIKRTTLELRERAAPTSFVHLDAWIGEDDTKINFHPSLNGAELYRFRNADCDIANVAACTSGQLDILDGSTITDTALNLSHNAYYQLRSGSGTGAATALSTGKFSAVTGHASVAFDSRLWVIGGRDGSGELTNEVWSSPDGVLWTLENGNPAFSPREAHEVVVFNDRMWLIGGTDGLARNDIWSSRDGSTWTQVTVNAGFSARIEHQVVAFDSKLWVIGGSTLKGAASSDVWSSSDGISWTRETESAAFSDRSGHRSVVFNDKIWVVGSRSKSDLWSSSDGINWALETDLAPFRAREHYQVVAYDDQLWWIGAGVGSNENDVWSSVDGVAWTRTTLSPGLASGPSFKLVAMGEKLWVIGARSYTWSSSDAANWEIVDPLFSPRHHHQTVVFNNRIWVIGGTNSFGDQVYRNDVWSSPDGLTWKLELARAPFTPRTFYQVVVFDNKMWLIGGARNGSYKYTNDVWSTEDGVNWTRATFNAAFSARHSHQVVAFNNRLWVIGGKGVPSYDTGLKNDVWSSSDGANWTLETGNAGFLPRTGHRAVVFDDKIWVIGGRGNDSRYKSDVWSSSDGVNWTKEVAFAPFDSRGLHDVVVYDDRLWVIGGYSGFSGLNDVWSSPDGSSWTREHDNAAFSPRYSSSTVPLDDGLVMIGGNDATVSNNEVWTSSDGISWRKGFTTEIPIN